jgi:hypothetical protein
MKILEKALRLAGLLLFVAAIVLVGASIKNLRQQRNAALTEIISLKAQVTVLTQDSKWLVEELGREHQAYHVLVDSIALAEEARVKLSAEWEKVAGDFHWSFVQSGRILEQMLIDAGFGEAQRQFYKTIEIDAHTHMALKEQIRGLGG